MLILLAMGSSHVLIWGGQVELRGGLYLTSDDVVAKPFGRARSINVCGLCKKYLTLGVAYDMLCCVKNTLHRVCYSRQLQERCQMNLSFQEKSLWLMFASLMAGFGFYFVIVLPTNTANLMPYHVVFFVLAVVLLVITQVVGHILIAAFDQNTKTDERDSLIELKGTRNGAYVLATGVFFALCAALLTEGNFIFMHVLLGFWVLSQLVTIASQLFWYRRGV